MNPSTAGAELELILIDQEGNNLNTADQILNDQRNDGSFVYESTLTQVEVNSDPSSTIEALHQNLKQKLSLLEIICQDYHSSPVSISEFGAGQGILRGQEKPTAYRWPIYFQIFGEPAHQELRTYSGIHLHLSQTPKKELQQYQLLLALDPLSYTLTSTSPINHQGCNGINCHRLHSFRRNVFKNLPQFSQLQDYPQSLAELNDRKHQLWQQCYDLALSKGVDPAYFKKRFQPDNLGYCPIRKRDHINPTGTYEIRSFDTTPLQIALAAFALYKGTNDQAMNQTTPIVIATKDDHYSFHQDTLVLPNYPTLLKMEDEAIRFGLRSELVRKYLQHVLPFAQQGLPQQDQQYLQTINYMLQTKNNPAAEIMQFMRKQGYQGHHFSPPQTAQANLFMREKYLSSLN